MNMPKIPYLIKQYNDFDIDFQNIETMLYKFSHLSYKGATILNTVTFLDEYATQAINLATRIDDYTSGPANEDNNFCLISDDLCKMYGEITDAGNQPLDSRTDPREAFDPEALRKVVEKLIRVFGLCEIYERSSLAKMLRGCTTLLLNGGVLPIIIGIYPAVRDGDVPNTQGYAEDPNAQGVEPKLAIVAEVVVDQIHFSAQEKEEIRKAEELKQEQERTAAELETMMSNLKATTQKIKALFESEAEHDKGLPISAEAIHYIADDNQYATKDEFDKARSVILFLEHMSTIGNPFKVLKEAFSGSDVYLTFTSTITPPLVAKALEILSLHIKRYVASTMETHTIIDNDFCEGWAVGDTFILSSN